MVQNHIKCHIPKDNYLLLEGEFRKKAKSSTVQGGVEELLLEDETVVKIPKQKKRGSKYMRVEYSGEMPGYINEKLQTMSIKKL